MAIDAPKVPLIAHTIGVNNTGEGLSLTIRNGVVVLAKNDPADKNQYWIKDNEWGATVKDDEGFPAFILINQGTGQALKHADHNKPVGLVKYDPENLDMAVLWSYSADVGNGYKFIRRIDNVNLVFDGEFGNVKDGSRLIIYNKAGSDNEKWRLDLAPAVSLRVHTIGVGNTGEGLSLTIRNGVVVLGTIDPADKNQYWIKVTKYANEVDSEEFPAFALVNKGTGQALKHADHNQPVGLVNYDPNTVDKSLLWTASADVGNGFAFIRRLDNVNLVFDGESGYVKDGTRLIMYKKAGSDNEKWKFDTTSDPSVPSIPTRSFRVHSFSALLSSLSIKNGAPVLVPDDAYDDFQSWIIDTRYGYQTDKEGSPAFSISNKVSGKILQHVKDGDKYKVELVTADPNKLTDNQLWTKGTEDFGQDYRNIRIINDTSIVLSFQRGQSIDAFPLLLTTDKTSKEAMWKFTPR